MAHCMMTAHKPDKTATAAELPTSDKGRALPAWLCVACVMLLACGESGAETEQALGANDESNSTEESAAEAAQPELPIELTEVTPEEVRSVLRERPEEYLLVNVWSTWCEPCVEEFPEIVQVGRDYASRDVGLLFFSVDPPSQREAALSFIEAQNPPMPTYLKVGSDQAFIPALTSEWGGALPATMIFDAERNVVRLWQEPVTRAMLEEALAGLGLGSED